MAFNTDQKHRSMVKVMEDYAFMGMEDEGITGDYDCNDVMFGIATQVDYEIGRLRDALFAQGLDHAGGAFRVPGVDLHVDGLQGRDFGIGLSIEFNVAAIGLVNAADDLDDRRFTATVLAIKQ